MGGIVVDRVIDGVGRDNSRIEVGGGGDGNLGFLVGRFEIGGSWVEM